MIIALMIVKSFTNDSLIGIVACDIAECSKSSVISSNVIWDDWNRLLKKYDPDFALW